MRTESQVLEDYTSKLPKDVLSLVKVDFGTMTTPPLLIDRRTRKLLATWFLWVFCLLFFYTKTPWKFRCVTSDQLKSLISKLLESESVVRTDQGKLQYPEVLSGLYSDLSNEDQNESTLEEFDPTEMSQLASTSLQDEIKVAQLT